jgi:hypothetical protein
MEFLGAWLEEYKKEVHPENLAEALLREMFEKAR